MNKAFLALLFLLSPLPAQAADTNPADSLISYDRDYYLQIFDYVMDNIEAGTSYDWRANSAKGKIAVGKEYMSKSNYACRDFAETFEIERKSGTGKGAGCKRQGKEGWCRITEGNPKTCALEKPHSKGEQVIDKATDAVGKISNWLR